MSSREVRSIGVAGWGRTLGAAVISLIYFFPVLFIILAAFKTRADVLAWPIKFVFTPTLSNFVSVFFRVAVEGGQAEATGFGLYFFNSLFIGGSSVLLALIIGTSAAYGFSRFPLRGNDTYLFMILTTRMMPPIIAIIPIFVLFNIFGLSGTYVGIIALYTAFNLPFSIWMVKSFFDDLDRDIEDAARMDGSSEWRVFRKVCLPQIYAGLAATFVFAIILTWNEFVFALLLTGTQTRTVPVQIVRAIGGAMGADWGLLSALETLFIIPVVLVTFALQNQLLRGVTFGTIRR
ncbi:MAG: carbohydrate ABC transporter permease [Alphaproteobacteria bacterium]|nr:carbohydrate ABC transporter permease [Alphaproteobacteria bacterium]